MRHPILHFALPQVLKKLKRIISVGDDAEKLELLYKVIKSDSTIVRNMKDLINPDTMAHPVTQPVHFQVYTQKNLKQEHQLITTVITTDRR